MLTARYLLITFVPVVSILALQARGQSVEETDVSILEIPSDDAPEPEKMADVQRVGQLVFDWTNEFRKKRELQPLGHDQHLQKTARYFADYMARTRRYGHLADGQRPAERAKKHGYEYCIVRENIAYSYKSLGFESEPLAEQVLTGWKQSEGHRENLLSPYVTEMAVAIARSDETGYYLAVQMFGRPKSDQVTMRFVNETDEEVKYRLIVQGQSESDTEFPLPPRLIRSHERCRPTSFHFAFMEKDQTYAVESGTTYVVTTTPEGEYQVVKRTDEPDAEEPSSDRSPPPTPSPDP